MNVIIAIFSFLSSSFSGNSKCQIHSSVLVYSNSWVRMQYLKQILELKQILKETNLFNHIYCMKLKCNINCWNVQN